MRLSLSITDYSWPDIGSELVRLARAADAEGQADPTSSPDSEKLEAYTASSPRTPSGCGSARWSPAA